MNILRIIGSITRIPAGWFYTGPASLINDATLEKIITDALETAFSEDAERLDRSKSRARQKSFDWFSQGGPIKPSPRQFALA